ncbi:copper amine oxidase N-terminal domain-containing protein [Paenibacillus dauci]|uniref:copper amine oxidase N-terminal domain-containing protein n=1 Tax=Paenibacillus dauci TaxID=1567106 RepID=UPI000619EA6A|nr:copper amine oxidase N-terminal domain-containing protein [Paenibacillus dauci]
MKKFTTVLLTCLLVTSMAAGTVMAKSDQGGKSSKSSSASSKSENKSKDRAKPEDSTSTVTAVPTDSSQPVSEPAAPAVEPPVAEPAVTEPAPTVQPKPPAEDTKANTEQVNEKEKQKKEKQNNGNGNGKANGHSKDKVEDSAAGVTDDVYGSGKGKQGYKGLLHAINNVKDKPAGQVLANLLLTQYETQLTPEMQAELEQIQNSKEALEKATDLLEESGNVDDAAALQEQVVQSDVTDLDSYKRLDELSDQTAADPDAMNLFVNGTSYTDAEPVVQDGTTLVPFRVVSEALNAKVTWNAKDQSVTVVKDGQTVKLYVNKKNAVVNGKTVSLQAAPMMKNGSTRVPVRVISEALGATVKWEPVSESVVIYEEKAST